MAVIVFIINGFVDLVSLFISSIKLFLEFEEETLRFARLKGWFITQDIIFWLNRILLSFVGPTSLGLCLGHNA